MRFRRLLELDSFDSAVALQVTRLLTAKCQAMEGDTAVPNPLLHVFLEQQLKSLTQHQATLKAQNPDIRLLDSFFQRRLLGGPISSA